jgi:transketolase
VVTVEDHYEHGGIGDVVLAALADQPIRAQKLAVRAIPPSGTSRELLHMFGIDCGVM